jgi:hypothetical protein
MTASARSGRASLRDRVSAWIARCQRQLSTWMHSAGDERARTHGWQVMETTGLLGFGGRRYRDPHTGNPESPGFLTVPHRCLGGGFAELPVVLRARRAAGGGS